MDENSDITRLLVAAAGGDPVAMDEVFASVFPRLRQIARARRRSWHGNPTLDTTALIHEAYLEVGQSSRLENVAETAEALEISPTTVKPDGSTAHAWLYREMQTERGQE